MHSQGQKAILCLNHPKPPFQANGYYKEYSMKEGKVTYPDKLDPTKEIVEEYLMCPRCFQTVPVDPELRKVLDGYNGITDKPTKPRKRSTASSAISDISANPATAAPSTA